MKKFLLFIVTILSCLSCSQFNSKYNLGLEEHKNGNYIVAERAYLEALQIEPNDADLNNNLGSLYLAQKEYEKAREYLLKAVQMKPTNGNFHYNLGILYQATSETNDALSEFKKSYERDSKNYKAAFNIGNLYFDMSDYNNAIYYFNLCTRINSDFKESYYSLALAYENKGEVESAIQFYDIYSRFVTDKDESNEIIRIIERLRESTQDIEEVIADIPPLPANLVISNIEFNEPSGNNMLDAGEKAEISLTVENKSQYPGKILLRLTPIAENLKVSLNKEVEIGEIKGLETKVITIPITADLTVPNQICRFRGEIIEIYYRLDPDPFTIEFSSKEFQKPELTVKVINIYDDKTLAPLNDNDGIVDQSETIKVELSVQNIGFGLARNVMTVINVEKTDEGSIWFRTEDLKETNRFSLGDLKYGEFKRIPFIFFTNRLYNYPEVIINVEAFDQNNYSSITEEIKFTIGEKPPTGNVIIVDPNESQEIVIDETRLVDVDNVPYIEKNENKRENTVVVIIGIEDYKYNAKATHKQHDAYILHEYMGKTLGVPDKNIKLVLNDFATKEEIDFVFDEKGGWLKPRIKPGITEVIVYLAGHGYPDIATNEVYFLPHDVRAERATSGVSLNTLYAKMARWDAKNTLVFVESCFSGMSADNIPLIQDINPIRIKIDFPQVVNENFVVITAASEQQVSSNSEKLKHGIFTYYLLKGMQGEANTNNDDVLTLSELWEYILTNVPEEALDTFNRRQTPMIFPDIELLKNKDLFNLRIVNYK